MKQKASSINKESLHQWDHKIKLIKDAMRREFSSKNVEIIEKYDIAMVNGSIQKATRYLHLNRLLSLTRRLGKNWNETTKEDIEKTIFDIMETYSDNGKDTEYTYDHKKVLKIFFRWLRFGNRSYKYCLKKFHAGDPQETEDIVMRKPEGRLTAEDILTDEEKEWLLDACKTPRERAIVDLPLDGGLRPGELLTLRICDISQDKHGFIAQVNNNGKTGPRPVRLIKCAPSLARWLSEHPFKNNSEHALFITLEKTKYGQPLSYSATRAILNRIGDRVKAKHPAFNKRLFLNIFRHTEATDTAKFLQDGLLTKKRHGWSSNSKMAARYTHLLNSDVDKAILEHHGIIQDDVKPKLPITCPACDGFNHHDAKICSKCSKVLDLKTALEIEERSRSELDDIMKKQEEILKKMEIQQEEMTKQRITLEKIEKWKTMSEIYKNKA